MRLYCFPYAGGSPGIFYPWKRLLPADIEICAPCLPGRGARWREKPPVSLPEAVAALVDQIPASAGPFAFFGHSLGALIAFELARDLRRRRRSGPSRLLVASREAPRIPHNDPPLRDLPDALFLAVVGERYQKLPPEILAEKELLELLLPALRADFAMFETYRYTPEAPLDCPITAFSGTGDRRVSPDHLEAWKEETASTFRIRMLAGGHFFFESDPAPLLQLLAAELREAPPSQRR